ncbi:hypothetical protein HAX54_017573 [Datura stramonium]|uniref:Uncharacterized protein n=1 Tax=Datura stramonium TaxID=4076 RepID=A0ABS8S0J3_DATST|nr:hypothetical protein [Datura stramonium]
MILGLSSRLSLGHGLRSLIAESKRPNIRIRLFRYIYKVRDLISDSPMADTKQEVADLGSVEVEFSTMNRRDDVH